MIEIIGMTKVYTTGKVNVEALRGIDLKIEKNDFISIMGPSGSGKSTLMNIIGCLDTPTQGEYHLEGMKVAELDPNRLADIRNQKIGFVFQNFNLLPYATAFENVEIPLIFKGDSFKKRKARTEELLEIVGLKDRMDHKPTELSGGEMQRVSIARALACNPSIILADEPTGNLDSVSGAEIIEIFVDLWNKGHTIAIITHDTKISSRTQRIIKLLDGMIVDGGGA
ncbi:MAG: macrolide ABC transporter ATP-binding protein [candidate division Zixibacteria bacterium SM23_73_2]|nr:MAG: macrolide ABC transporter ATP-binding protein [candidate division Zixibacteria bacterium SM23_73_2]